MRIKFLSFIASFFVASFMITSCLDNDNNIEYSPDATIHAFELDTIGYGISYKFTIDQLKGEIYNEDSLPVHADTIIDKILIKTLTTASGVITMKSTNNEDSIINISDSIDLRKELKIKVWSTVALAGSASSGQTKEYTIRVNVHRHDPDSLKWNYVGEMDGNITKEQKTVLFNGKYLTYSTDGNDLKVYANSLSDWSAAGESVTGITSLPNSILALEDRLLATVDNKVYESADGITWSVSDDIPGEVNTLISIFPLENDTQVTYIKTEDGKRYYYSILASAIGTENAEKKGEEVDEHFPVDNISYTIINKGSNDKRAIIVGRHAPAITLTVDDVETPLTIAFGYDGNTWAELGTSTSTIAYCPAFDNPKIIYYNDLLYVFGNKCESIYVSQNEGIAWTEADKKFHFPHQEWGAEFIPSTDTPEFRGRSNYSVIQDNENNYVYFLFSKGEASFTDGDNTHSYSHGAEVWRTRLNQLWFDLAKAGK